MNAQGRPVRKWKLADLREHPRQHELFGDLPDGPLGELAADMDANGQRDPIEILPDGTIIDGHQRHRAAEKLGWSELDAVVRNDLEFEGEKAIERHMIDANLNRRQLDPLAIARLYQRLRQLERDGGRDYFSHWERGELRDSLAKRLGAKSGRMLDRYLQLLDAPLAVQRCVSRGELPMQAALKVLRLTPEHQDAVAAAIEAGQRAKDVIARHFPRVPTAPTARPRPSLGNVLEIPGDLGELQPAVQGLQEAILEFVRAELPPSRKIAAIDEAVSVFQDTLIEHEQRCQADDDLDALDEPDEE